MGRKYTGRAIRRRAEVRQKNGDIYVYDRIYQYDREKKKTVVVYNKLIEKRRAGGVVETAASVPDDTPAVREQATGKRTAAVQPGRRLPPADLAEIQKWCEDRSRVREALALYLPPKETDAALSALWQVLFARTEAEISKDPAGLLTTLFYLRLPGETGEDLRLCTMRHHGGWAAAIAGRRLLGLAPLSEDLALSAGVAQLWRQADADNLLLLHTYLDTPVHDARDIARLRRFAQDFVCPLDKASETGRLLLSRLQLRPFRDGVFLPGPHAWACTFPVCISDIIEVTEEAACEAYVHVYVLPEEKGAGMQHLRKKMTALGAFLNSGGDEDDLTQKKQALIRRFLKKTADGRWQMREEEMARAGQPEGIRMLIANGIREPGEALALCDDAERIRCRYLKGTKKKSAVCARVFSACLRQTLRQLLKAAARIPADADAAIERAAAGFLRKGTPEELPAVFSAGADRVVEKRNDAIRQKIALAMAHKKTAPV